MCGGGVPGPRPYPPTRPALSASAAPTPAQAALSRRGRGAAAALQSCLCARRPPQDPMTSASATGPAGPSTGCCALWRPKAEELAWEPRPARAFYRALPTGSEGCRPLGPGALPGARGSPHRHPGPVICCSLLQQCTSTSHSLMEGSALRAQRSHSPASIQLPCRWLQSH